MARLRYSLCALLVLCPLALSRHDDDFAFDNSEEFQVELTANHSEIAKNGLRRLWGVPDTSAYVGHLFRMEIPKEAFSGEVLAYKVRGEGERHTPSWMAVDSRHGLISGVPLAHDRGAHTFTVTAHGRTAGLTATDTFTVEVKKAEEKPQSKYGSCAGGLNRLLLTILLETPFAQIAPRQRIRALMDLANFMALDGDEFWIEPYKPETNRDNTVLMSGAGTTQRRRGDGATAIYLNVGCGDKLWSRHKVLVTGLREQARDGTLSHVLHLPVFGWRLTSVKPAPRLKRQLTDDVGSGGYYEGDDDDDADYSGYDDEEDDYGRADFGPVSSPKVDPPPPPPSPTPAIPSPHPHRHHHGEIPPEPEYPSAPRITTSETTLQTETTEASEATITSSPATVAPPPPPAPPSTSVASPPSTLGPVPAPAPPPHTTTTEEPPTDAPVAEETTPEPATTTNAIVTEERTNVKIEAYPESASEASNVNYTRVLPTPTRNAHSPVIIVPDADIPTSTEPELQTVIIRASNEVPIPSSTPTPVSSSPTPISTSPTTPASPTQATTPEITAPSPPAVTSPPPTSPTTSTSTKLLSTATTVSTPKTTLTTTPTVVTTPEETTLSEVTKQETIPATERSSTIIGRTTETVTFGMPANQAPTLKHHMKKLAITAGKAFRYIIPADLFTDPEDGTNLTFTMYEADNVPLSKNSWIQFTPSDREVYGLPLESHVSRWNFIVEARDSEGATARGPLDITVQQHKGRRTVNHQFLIKFKLIKNYLLSLDWQIRALEGIVNLFRDTDMDHLTVLNVTSSGDVCEFVWTNDTLPKETCPTDDINRLMKIMQVDSEPGSPSAGLSRAMSPELKAVAVSWTGVGSCAGAGSTPPPVAPRAPDTYPPVTRNQVDHLTAIAGHLLVYRVPEDTFFDPEDGGTRNLKLSLRFSDRSELPDSHWLQFDSRNQEFYGLPTADDEGSVQYQLVAEDSSNKSAYDSLIVEVVKAPSIRPTVEFHMTMEYPTSLAYSALTKRKVVEKLAALFEQKDTRDLRIQSITDNPTTIVWYNTSLPMDRCPNAEIDELRRMVIIVDERGRAHGALRPNVDVIFDKDFKVMSIRFVYLGLCAEQGTKTSKTQGTSILPDFKHNVHPNTNTKSVNSDDYTDYIVTFVIPAVVIVCMILVAGIIACVLYRRRRTGKMSVGDEEERQAFRSKGIPVIFQDELEERGDTEPVHKSPVIMREEKPPLLPPAPDYRADDAPYRPPPPFAASRTPPRPKATPVYRKPPPYVAP